MAPIQPERLAHKVQERLQDRLQTRVKELERAAAQLREENALLRHRLSDQQARLEALLAQPWQALAGDWRHYRTQMGVFLARHLPRLMEALTRKKSQEARQRLMGQAATSHLARHSGASFRTAEGEIREGFVFVSSHSPLFDASLLNQRLLAEARDFSPADLISQRPAFLPAPQSRLGGEAHKGPDLYLPAQDERLATQAGWKKDGLILVDRATSGAALFGPYVDLPAGSYRVRVLLAPHRPASGPVTMELVPSSARLHHAQQHFTLTRLPIGAGELTLVLDSPAHIAGLEVRVLCQGMVEMAIIGVEISPLSSPRALSGTAAQKAKQK